MSDYLVKIIPKEPFARIEEQTLRKAAYFLETNLRCDSVQITCSPTPVFVDCGSNLERILCPECGAGLSFDWWGKAMSAAGENDFTSLETTLPCCGKNVFLNELEYHFPCGSA